MAEKLNASKNPMNILLLSNTSPFPPNNGVKMRTWAVLSGLAAEGHAIDLVVFKDSESPAETPAELARVCRKVILIPHSLKSVSSSKDYVGRLLYLFSKAPFGTRTARSQEMRELIERYLREKCVDVILVEQTDLLINLPERLALPLIIDFHNADHLIFERYAKLERNPAKKLYALLESRKVRAWEQAACRRGAAAMACSEFDRQVLQELAPAKRVISVPNVVDVDTYVPKNTEDSCKILFQGGMDWYPNRDAVEFFVSDILPLIRKAIPGVRFVAAGRNPPAEFQERLSREPGVDFTGTVKDMRKIVADAAVCVIPLRVGSGTRLKILEGAAMAKAMVSTTLGAEGLEFGNESEILIADSPADFASAVVGLLRDSEKRKSLGSAARARVEKDYSFLAMRAALRRVLQDSFLAAQGNVSYSNQ